MCSMCDAEAEASAAHEAALANQINVGDLVTHAHGAWSEVYRVAEIIPGDEPLAKFEKPANGEWGGFWRVSQLRHAPPDA